MANYYFEEELGFSRRKTVHNSLMVCGLVVVWYLSAIVTITTSKEIMNTFKYPFFLCCTQFTLASIISILYLKFTGTYVPMSSGVKYLVFQISMGYTFGFILTNCAFSIVSAGFAETVKSAEPISTILIGLFFFRETSSLRTYLTLVPICLGVGLSCYHNEEFNVLGFLLAAGSNVCFSSRAVLAKKLAVSHTDAVDEINLFASISVYGVCVLLPITAAMEGRALMSLSYGTDRSGMNSSEGSSSSYVTALFVLNGTMFACYNLMSYIVLRYLDLVTHSVLNVFRRVVIIVFTSVYFAMYLSPFNLLGIAIAVAGVLLFGYFRTTDKPKSLL